MNNSELIKNVYSISIKEIQEDWFTYNNTKWYDYVENLPIKINLTYLVINFHNQVFNGGFHQYFVNGYGQFAIETIEALLEIGASKKSKLLKKALYLVNYDNLSNEVFRKELLNKELYLLFVSDSLFDPLEELDAKYYDIEDEEIEDLLGTYLLIQN
jgi:hypothetical protein